ncbi:hypothetical protein BDA96_08G094900 [Sorghum bicolor]|uniref:DUF295 domain-containing protein n=1 Tax=Sorghum bicolor TaxID=4558 RepID=A0A921QFE1_SORBI|nr:hypothetical protein BDA96_08G094900 [Sorghum bicolor]KAG0520682.1 hypothetical protein BDA96_08G094900 [Sorghum bicolor]
MAGSDLAPSAFASASCPSSARSRERRADAPRPDPASSLGPRPPVPRRARRGGALMMRCGQMWPRFLRLHRLSIGKRARKGRRPAAARSGLDGSPSAPCPSASGPRRQRARRTPTATAAVDWSLLPEELLLVIMGQLEVIDLVRSGAACSSWHPAFTAFRRLRIPSPKQAPCALYTARDEDPDIAVLCAPCRPTSIGASRSRLPSIRTALPGLPLSRRTFVGSAYGWLVTADEDSNLHVVNLLIGAQVALPPLASLYNVESLTDEGGDLTYRVFVNREADEEPTDNLTALAAREIMYFRAVLLCSPSAGAECIVLLIHWPEGELSFARLGDESWMPVSAMGHGPLERSGYHDAVYNSDNGLFYVLRFDGAIYTLDLNGHSPSASRIMRSAMPIYHPGRTHDLITMYLVKTPSGDLLQVFRWIEMSLYPFRHPPYTDDNEFYSIYAQIESFDVQVFKVDLHGQKLDHITTLGDHSLFLGYNNSMCISTKDLPMLEPNLFYLMDNCKHVYKATESFRDMGFYKIGEIPIYNGGPRTPNHGCFPFASKPFPVPIWITPSVY